MVLFGGTFDPVHFGHLIAARAVAEQRGFDRITLIPTARPPHKTNANASGEHRLAMLEGATRGDELFEISQIELYRAGPSFTFDTLRALRDEHGPDTRLYWIIGADMLAGLDTWSRAEEVLEMAEIIVAARPPFQEEVERVFLELEGKLPRERIERIRAGLTATPLIDISSSDIRKRVTEGCSVRYLVPEPIRVYIDEHALYR